MRFISLVVVKTTAALFLEVPRASSGKWLLCGAFKSLENFPHLGNRNLGEVPHGRVKPLQAQIGKWCMFFCGGAGPHCLTAKTSCFS